MAHESPPHRLTIRPLGPRDATALAAAFDRLSPRSRFQRFLGHKKQLTPAELEHLTNLDHVDHEAIAAFDQAELVGVARYIRDPGNPAMAELAVTVTDRYQGRGVGTYLLQRLVDRAIDEGLARFRAEILTENRRVLGLLRRIGLDFHLKYLGAGVLEAVIVLPVSHPSPEHVKDAA